MENYDDKIDWRRFYGERVTKTRKSGNKVTGLCPFHDNTKTPAFWANLENGMWKCEAGCGQGNATTFLAKLDGISTAEADAKLRDMAGIVREAAKPTPRAVYGVDAYAAEKLLDPDKLREWGLTDSRGSVLIPYKSTDGSITATRRRHAPGRDPRFTWAKGSTLGLYGLDHLGDGAVVLVEGESDCHALWSLGITALGVPGASTFKAAWVPPIAERDVYIHHEGDSGADVFCARVLAGLAEAGYTGHAARFSTPGDIKDPSELYRLHGERAGDELREAIRGAVSLDMPEAGADTTSAGILAERGLRCPRRWHCDERGISAMTDEGDMRNICATPIVISRRIIDAQTRDERVELAMRRDGKWRTIVADRDAAFSTRNIVSILAPMGANVTSENARHIVKWLGALEAENMESLPYAKSANAFGWCGDAFLPVMPGDILLDADESGDNLAAAFEPKGSLAVWCDAMAPHREFSPTFRFMLSSSFAAPLLRAVKGRILFVYNWGPSRGGKTAAVKAAISAWGDPEQLLTTFNSTVVGLERMAGLMRDLPLVVDERQVAGGDQRRLDQIVYTLASGTGRVRGARDGGLQATQHWRTIVLSTGEEPLTGTKSQTGVSTRVLELFGAPFYTEADAAAIHRTVSEHYGAAGKMFLTRLMALGEAEVERMHTALVEKLEGLDTGKSSSHLSGIALVAIADMLVSMWLYGATEAQATEDAHYMASYVLQQIDDAAVGNIDESACQFIEGWLRREHGRFDSPMVGPVFGAVYDDVYKVLVPTLKDVLEAAGYSYRKTLKALDERGALTNKTNNDTTPTSVQRIDGKPCRVVCIDLGVLLGDRALTEVKEERAF